MGLKASIQEATKSAMRARDTEQLGTLRMLTAAIKQVEIDEKNPLDDNDAGVVGIIRKMIKQRRDAIEQYERGGRPDLAEAEAREIGYLNAFLPPELSDGEIGALIKTVIEETGASSPKDMGKVVSAVRQKVEGRADMGKVSGLIKQMLSQLN